MAAKKYDDLSKDELIRLLESRDRRDATRFGLVWEANEIERDKALNQDFVALDLDPALSCPASPSLGTPASPSPGTPGEGGGAGAGAGRAENIPGWKNLIIEGDNFDALRYLRMTFAGRVKCIYIDPPYNTGNKDFVYNDHFVDKEDLWRHSKWCEFMFQRLTLACDLLRKDGVMFINIGQDEVNHLGCLLDRVFPNRYVATFVWRTRSGANDSKEYFRSIDHEYVLCVANREFVFGGHGKALVDYANPDNDPRGLWVSADLCKAHNYRDREGTYYAIQNPTTGIWYPANPDRVWAHASGVRGKNPNSKIAPHIHHHLPETTANAKKDKYRSDTMADFYQDNKILWPVEESPVIYSTTEELKTAIRVGTAPKNLRDDLPDLDFWVGKPIGKNTPRRKKFKDELKKLEKPLSTWIIPAADKEEVEELADTDTPSTHLQTKGTADGTALLRRMLGDVDFPYPKPLPLVHGLLDQVTDAGDIIVDFFAGSGTTAHAVLALNAEDGGDRRCILVSSTERTNDAPEKNVCLDVCRRRVKAAIDGYSYSAKKGIKSVEGLGGDFAYLRCRRIGPGKLMDIDHAQVWTALQLTHTERLTEYRDEPILQAGDEEQMLIYLPHFKAKDAKALKKAVESASAVIVYSWQPELIRQRLREYPQVQVEAVPESLARRFGMRI